MMVQYYYMRMKEKATVNCPNHSPTQTMLIKKLNVGE